MEFHLPLRPHAVEGRLDGQNKRELESKMEKWARADIQSLDGQNIIITGANSGIGYQAVLSLAAKGARIILACRDQAKGEAAILKLGRAVPAARATFSHLDLSSLTSVRRFAERFLETGQSLNCLINNAGVMAPPRRFETEDGFELQFGTNVLGHFALTGLLMPALQRATKASVHASPGLSFARVVTVASIAHKGGAINFDDLQYERAYSPMGSYAQSKLANLMLALELDRRLRHRGQNILSVAVHPGVAATNLFRAGDYNPVEKMARNAIGPLIALALNSEAAGALPTLYAATSDTVVGGGYYGPQGIFEARGNRVGNANIAPQALDLQVATRLWETCETLVSL